MDVWTCIYILGLFLFTIIASLHVFAGIFDELKYGKKLFICLLIFCLILIFVGLSGSLMSFELS